MTSEEEEYCSPDGLLFRTRGNEEEEDPVWSATHSVTDGIHWCANMHTVIKSWYRCVVPDQVTLADFYHQSKKIYFMWPNYKRK